MHDNIKQSKDGGQNQEAPGYWIRGRAISWDDFMCRGPQIASALSSSTINVHGANKMSLGPVGTFPGQIEYHGRTYSNTVGVFQHVSVTIFSLSGCKALGLASYHQTGPALIHLRLKPSIGWYKIRIEKRLRKYQIHPAEYRLSLEK